MTRSIERILTTHVGSLPRSAALVALLYTRRTASRTTPRIRRRRQAAVDEVVAKQVEIGIDIVSDGEMGKVGYATYVKDRLSGFAGHYPRPPHLDLAPYPEFRDAMARDDGQADVQARRLRRPGRAHRSRRRCKRTSRI